MPRVREQVSDLAVRFLTGQQVWAEPPERVWLKEAEERVRALQVSATACREGERLFVGAAGCVLEPRGLLGVCADHGQGWAGGG